MNKTQKTVLVAAILGTIGTVIHFMTTQKVFKFLSEPHQLALPIILVAAVATLFAWLAWAQESRKFVLASAILYVAILLFWGSGFFVYTVPAIILFVCYFKMKG
jgi:hypothetical protein